jgi:hypothetical protein
MIRQNPRVANNPQAQEMINVIQSGDDARGQQIANNICQTMGVTQQQAINDARSFFRI